MFVLVPIPLLDVSLSRNTNILVGSNLTLTCDTNVDLNVDTPFVVDVTWNMTDQQIMSGAGNYTDQSLMLVDTNRVNISSLMMTDVNLYRSQVDFLVLNTTEDSGVYTCIVKIVSENEYVMTSNTSTKDINLTVTGMYQYACPYIYICIYGV